MEKARGNDFRHEAEHLEALIRRFDEVADQEVRTQARELVRTLLQFHGVALSRLVEQIARLGEAGRSLLTALGNDELVSHLLLLHGLHPLDLEARVQQALDAARPALQAHHGDVELVGIDEGVVRLRLRGNCHGCPSSSLTLTNVIEEALLAAAPDVAGIEIEGDSADHDGAASLLPIVTLGAPLSDRLHALPR